MNDQAQTRGLIRGIGLPQALALNVNAMIGIGPFITIPLLIASMHGPQALLGWVVGALLAACDGLVWAELSASLPGSGGSYVYLREAYGPRWGRLMSFLFIWQVCFHAPLSLASGAIGFAHYLAYLAPGLVSHYWAPIPFLGVHVQINPLASCLALLITALLYRRITAIGRTAIFLLAGVLAALGLAIAAGVRHFSLARALDFPPGAFQPSRAFWFGLGAASLIAIYDYLGYYNVCYIGDEVKQPRVNIPRAILWSIAVVAALYLAMNLTLIGSLPWKEVQQTTVPMSLLMQRSFGVWAARVVTVLVLWTAFASIFSLLLGASRIPYAAAVDGNFFRPFGRLHPRLQFPHVSLVVLGCLAAFFALFPLAIVIPMLIVIRIPVQFIGQIMGLLLLRRARPDVPRPFRMWLYPLPAIVALVLWAYIFVTAGKYMLAAAILFPAGIVAFLLQARRQRAWPFEAEEGPKV